MTKKVYKEVENECTMQKKHNAKSKKYKTITRKTKQGKTRINQQQPDKPAYPAQPLDPQQHYNNYITKIISFVGQ